MSEHELGLIVAVASLITALVAFSSIYFLRKQFIISEKSLDASQLSHEAARKSYEVDTLLRIKAKFLEKDILELSEKVLYEEQPIFKNNGGTIERKTVYNTLNIINEIGMFVKMGIVSEYLIVNSLGGIICNIYNDKEIQEYIQEFRTRLGSKTYWAYGEKITKKYELNEKKLSNKKKDIKS